MEAIAATAERATFRGWLHGPVADLTTTVGPWLFVVAMLASGAASWHEPGLAVWIAQYVVGNTTHVVLTFLLLAFRRDILHATPTQARVVVWGSAATFVVTWAIFRAVQHAAPSWTSFPIAVAAIFGTHHRLAQGKGVWSLYNLRAAQLGFEPPTPRERSLQQAWTAVGLLPLMVSWLFLPVTPHRMFPLIQAIPNEPAFLPYEVSYMLVLGWSVYVGLVLVELGRARRRNVPKMLHVASHGASIAFAIAVPLWGPIVWGCIHGIEYGLLCDRMMRPRPGDTFAGPGSALATTFVTRGLIVLSLLPLVYVGLTQAPFARSVIQPSAFDVELLLLLNALVAAHYFADAYIYRFRIPGVRKVALTRLGFH